MATAPLPVVTSQAAISANQPTTTSNDSSPYVAIDPVNPLKMVMVYTDHDPNTADHRDADHGAGGVHRATAARRGRRWRCRRSFDPSMTNTSRQYTSKGSRRASGIDQNEILYIGVLESEPANTSGRRADGEVRLQPGDAESGPQTRTSLYQWNRSSTDDERGTWSRRSTTSRSRSTTTCRLRRPDDRRGPERPERGRRLHRRHADTPARRRRPPPPWNRYTVALVGSTDGVNFTAPTPT